MTPELVNLPEDSEALKALVRSLLLERDRETQRAEQQQQRDDRERPHLGLPSHSLRYYPSVGKCLVRPPRRAG